MRWVAQILFVFSLMAGCLAAEGWAQLPPADSLKKAWKPLLEHENVAFSYLFYRTADNANNGVVVMLHNRNDYAVRYRFRIIFRAPDSEHEELATGLLGPGERKTGDSAGLFWIPFKDGRSIAEIGLRGYRIERLEPGEAS